MALKISKRISGPARPTNGQPVQANDLFRGTQKSLWNFWRDGVTSSFLNSYMTCREQTRLHYVEGWSSYHVPLAFEFGTCCHWVLEQCYNRLKVNRELPQRDTIARWVKAYEQKWLKEVMAPTQKQLDQQELVYGMTEAILPAYFDRWAGDFTGKYHYPNATTRPVGWHSLEEIFCVPYVFPDGEETCIRGRRDGVFLDRFKKPWVFDTKCRSVIDHDAALDTLPFDTQQMLYLYVTSLQGLKPVGTVMNIIRRPGQRRLMDEALYTFIDRIRGEVSKPKNYDHYFIRYEMAVDQSELLTWKKNKLDPLMQEVRGWWEGTIPHYMNDGALITKYGHCQMYLPIVKDEFGQCYKRKVAFGELEAA